MEHTRGRSTLPAAAQALREAVGAAVGRLLGQLYDRNCRRQFAPPEAFYAPQLSEALFDAEVQAVLEKGAFLEAQRSRVWLILRRGAYPH